MYPETQSGGTSLLENLTQLVADDFFSVLELTWIKDSGTRKATRDIAESARVTLTYGAQMALLSQKLDLNSVDNSQRSKAVQEVKICLDEASELGAERLSLLSGFDPGESQRKSARELFADSLREICAYGEQREIGVTLETFDREVEKRCLIGPSREAVALARTIRKEYPSFGIMYDMAHGPLLNENPRTALRLLKDYLVHIHLGNCVKTQGHPAYGDRHPRFGVEGGEHDVEDLTRFLKILFDIGYLGKRAERSRKLPIVGFEIKPLPGEKSEAVLAGTKRVWRQAWAQLQRRS